MSDCFGRFFDAKAPECQRCGVSKECKVIQDNDMADATVEEKIFVILSVMGRRSAEMLSRALGVKKSEVEKVLKKMPGVGKETWYKIRIKEKA